MKSTFITLIIATASILIARKSFAQDLSISNHYKEAAIGARCLAEITNCPERKAWMIKLAESCECHVKTLISGSNISQASCEKLKPLTMTAPNCPDDASMSTEEVNRYLADCKNGKQSYLPGSKKTGDDKSSTFTSEQTTVTGKPYNYGNTEVGRAIIDRYELPPDAQNELNKLTEQEQALAGGVMMLGEGIGKLIDRRREKKKSLQKFDSSNSSTNTYSQSTTSTSQDAKDVGSISQNSGSDVGIISESSGSTVVKTRKPNDISYVFSAGLTGLATPVLISNRTDVLLNNPLTYSVGIGALRKRGLSWSLNVSGVHQEHNEFVINAEAVNGDYYDYTGKLKLKATDVQFMLGKDFNGSFDKLHIFLGGSLGVMAISKHFWEHGVDLDHFEESSLKETLPHGSAHLNATIFVWKNLAISGGIAYNIFFNELTEAETSWYRAKSFLSWNAGITYRLARFTN